jgi:hypothetical protein
MMKDKNVAATEENIVPDDYWFSGFIWPIHHQSNRITISCQHRFAVALVSQ